MLRSNKHGLISAYINLEMKMSYLGKVMLIIVSKLQDGHKVYIF